VLNQCHLPAMQVHIGDFRLQKDQANSKCGLAVLNDKRLIMY
jgi:hypothetical protein